MCGISGVFSLKSEVSSFEKQLRAAAKAQFHRGPDHQGYFNSVHFIASHNRLSIIDISEKAHQPMRSDDGNYVLIFNGELFNFSALKTELIALGVSFKSNSDTEVLLQLLMREGENCLSRLNGFFSFAFYSLKQNELLLARDRFGEKPLHYSLEKDVLFFSSEMNGLEHFPISKTIDQDALHLYFQYSYIPAPYTIYESCKKLEPGYFLKINSTETKHINYYQPKTTSFNGDYNEASKQLKSLVFDAVEKRMISDVPLASFLSGGLDSSIISGIACEFKSDLQTFSIGFPEHSYFDETEYAITSAKHIKSKHEVIPISAKELNEAIDPLLNSFAEPFSDSSALPMYLLCKKVKQHCTVALSGDGADELFAGYNKHRAFFNANKRSVSNFLLSHLPLLPINSTSRDSTFKNKLRQIKKYQQGLKLNLEDRYKLWASFTNEKQVQELLLYKKNKTNNLSLNFSANQNDNLNQLLINDIKLVLANDMLTKVDLMSMQHAVEVRPPFLDYRIVEFANSLPFHFKMDQHSNKKILRDTFANWISKETNKRPKKGFEVPLRNWFMGSLNSRINKEWLHPDLIDQQGIFNPEIIKLTLSNLNKGKMNENTIWSLIVFQQWWINKLK